MTPFCRFSFVVSGPSPCSGVHVLRVTVTRPRFLPRPSRRSHSVLLITHRCPPQKAGWLGSIRSTKETRDAYGIRTTYSCNFFIQPGQSCSDSRAQSSLGLAAVLRRINLSTQSRFCRSDFSPSLLTTIFSGRVQLRAAFRKRRPCCLYTSYQPRLCIPGSPSFKCHSFHSLGWVLSITSIFYRQSSTGLFV